jgi:2'-5' RNA ligase
MYNPLFFIALLPDLEIQKEVTGFKQICADKFEARHAFKSPPHITLQSPFRWPMEKINILENALANFSEEQFSFSINLKNFAAFAPRVIYVNVEKNESLKSLHDDLEKYLLKNIGLKNKRSHGFNPHMTIAHRDLKKEIFPAAWNYFWEKKYERQFLAERLTLLKHVKGKWEIWEEFGLG